VLVDKSERKREKKKFLKRDQGKEKGKESVLPSRNPSEATVMIRHVSLSGVACSISTSDKKFHNKRATA
jgi:hypothetical protein